MKTTPAVEAALKKGNELLANLPKDGPARSAYLAKVVEQVFKEVGLTPPTFPKRLANAA